MAGFPELITSLARIGFAAIACMAPAACSHVPVSSMLTLSRLDLATTDLSRFRAAIRVPDSVVARGTRMVVEMVVEGRPPEKNDFALEALSSPEELEKLAAHGRAGERIAAYRLPASAVAMFEDMRHRVGVAKAEKRKGSLSIRLEPDFCYRDTLPQGKLLFSSYLAAAETKGYVPLLVDFDAFSQKEYAEKLKLMPKC